MAMNLAKKANDAFVDDNFELVAELYMQAIAMDSTQIDLFADRVQANIKLENFTDVVADASRAIELDSLMAKAYFRKGVSCLKLEEYQIAKIALHAGASLAPEDARFAKLFKECDEGLAGSWSFTSKN